MSWYKKRRKGNSRWFVFQVYENIQTAPKSYCMEIHFIGVGEACDDQHGNTSIHVRAANGIGLLCDCGFSAPHSYFSFYNDTQQTDLVWISHFHGDHFFGIPLFLLRFLEMRRSKPLHIIGQNGIEKKIFETMDLAFPRFRAKLCYELVFHEIEPGEVHKICDLKLETVQTLHSQRNLGLLVNDGKNKIYYSGDGRPTEKVADLVRDCDLAVHEAFRLDEEIHHHGSMTGCLKLAYTNNIKKMALVHLERNFRRQQVNEINRLIEENPVLCLPVTGDRIQL